MQNTSNSPNNLGCGALLIACALFLVPLVTIMFIVAIVETTATIEIIRKWMAFFRG